MVWDIPPPPLVKMLSSTFLQTDGATHWGEGTLPGDPSGKKIPEAGGQL